MANQSKSQVAVSSGEVCKKCKVFESDRGVTKKLEKERTTNMD